MCSFFENLERIASSNYIPSEIDILKTQVRESGANTEITLEYGDIHEC